MWVCRVPCAGLSLQTQLELGAYRSQDLVNKQYCSGMKSLSSVGVPEYQCLNAYRYLLALRHLMFDLRTIASHEKLLRPFRPAEARCAAVHRTGLCFHLPLPPSCFKNSPSLSLAWL